MNTLRNPKKFLTQRSGMTHAQWRRASKLNVTPRFFHTSCTIVYLPDPASLIDGLQRPPKPYAKRTKTPTYDAGRNAAKRYRSAQHRRNRLAQWIVSL